MMANNTVTMNVTKSVIENVTDFMNTVNSEEDFGNALTAILWLIVAPIILLLCLAASCFR